MEPQAQDSTKEIPEYLQAFIDSATPPSGQGNAYFKLNWTILLMFVPYLVYALVLLPIPFINWALLAYSLILITLYGVLMSGFKDQMAYISNPFDFVKVEFINLINVIVFFGLAYFFLSKTGNANFNQELKAFDGVYFSFVTIATVGYGDISPISTAAKSIVIFEICTGLWFFVTVIPVAVADQAERLKHIRTQRQRMAEALKKAHEQGELKKVTSVRNGETV